MKKTIEKLIIRYLSRDEARARRIIKKAQPSFHVAERPRVRKGKEEKAA